MRFVVWLTCLFASAGAMAAPKRSFGLLWLAASEGKYEIVSARCTAGSGEMLVDTAVKLLKDLRSPTSTP